MPSRSLLVCVAMAAAVVGVAAQTQVFTVNYNFETFPNGNEFAVTTELQQYNLLNFSGLNYANTDDDHDGNHLGIAPHSYPSVAAFSLNTALLDTVGSLLPDSDIAPSSTPRITANYTTSTITSFDALSWWYGCVLPSGESAGSLPADCNITATGYARSGKLVASQVFSFKANGSQVQDQNFGVFKGFAGIYTLDLAVTEPATTAALVDNFIANLYQPASAPLTEPGSY